MSQNKKNVELIKGNSAYLTLFGYRKQTTHDLSENLRHLLDSNNQEVDAYKGIKALINSKFASFSSVFNLEYDILEDLIGKLNDFQDIELCCNIKNMIIPTPFETIVLNKHADLTELYNKNVLRLEKFCKTKNTRLEYLIGDIIFRIFEIIKGCYHASLSEKEYAKRFMFANPEIITDSVDKEYLIYSSCVRMYICYDKLAKFISKKYLLSQDKQVYFDTFLNNVVATTSLLKKCSEAKEDQSYKFLNSSRNKIVHSIRDGCVYTDALPHYENTLLIAVLNNLDIVSSLLDEL